MKKIFTVICFMTASNYLAAQNDCPTIRFDNYFNYVCSYQNLSLAANVSNAVSFSWSTSGGGSFVSPGSASTNYIAVKADSSKPYLRFTFTATSAQGCQKTDTVNFYIQTSTSVSAGPDQRICRGDSISLQGNYKYAKKGTWATTGSGVLYTYPNADYNAIYFASAADKAAGRVALSLTAEANGNCRATTDSIVIRFLPKSGLTLQMQSAACDSFMVQALGTGIGQITWGHTGSGYFSLRENTFSQYVLSAADILKPNFMIYASLLSPGNCPREVDTILVKGHPSVQVEAGETQTFIDTDTIKLNGTMSNSPGVSWSSDGTGRFIPNNTGLKSYYLPSDADKDKGYLFLKLSAAANSNCPAKQDFVMMVFKNRFTISGAVNYQPSAPVAGKIILYRQTGNPLTFVTDSTIYFDTLSKFSFPNLKNGKYLILAQPVTSNNQNFVPTYYGNVSTWETASVIQVANANVLPMNITLLKNAPSNTTWNQGTDAISGNVTTSTPLARVTASQPIQDATVSLFDNNGNFLSYVYTDADGEYLFDHLIAGNYTVKIEYAGKTSVSQQAIADGNPATPSVTNFEVRQSTITSNATFAKALQVQFYPNPVADQMHVLNPFGADETTMVSISDNSGNVVFTGRFPARQSFDINTASLASGFYIVEMTQSTSVARSKFVKVN